MVKELKTLKDIIKDNKRPFYAGDLVHREDLRQEAINWVKGFRQSQRKNKKQDREYVKKEMVIIWIKKFFNLKDGEL